MTVPEDMQPFELEVEGLALAGLVKNRDAGGLPIICLHGWLDNAASFLPLVNALSPHSPCYLLDWPGHGLSQHLPKGAQYHFVDWAEWLHRFICHYQFDRVVVIGHSLGALVGSLYAATFPDKIDRLVMLDGMGPLEFPADSVAKNLRKAIIDRMKQDQSKKPVYASFEDAVDARMRAGKLSLTSAKLLAERGCINSQNGWQWRYDSRLKNRTALRMVDTQVEAVIRHIELPVLAIIAENGFPEMVNLVKQRESLFPQITLKKLPGGHHLHMDDPAPLVPILKKFLTFT